MSPSMGRITVSKNHRSPTRWDNDLCQTSGIEKKKKTVFLLMMLMCFFILNRQSIYIYTDTFYVYIFIYTHQNVFLARTKAASW